MDDQDFQDLRTELKVFVATVEQWMENTTEYRKELYKKIEELKDNHTESTKNMIGLNDKINLLPCEKRVLWYDECMGHIRGLWATISGVVIGGIIFGIWIKVVLAK